MNITIFGGTGPAGLLTIQKALSSGHQVIAYARTPSKISIQHDNLEIVKGELNEANKIAEALKDSDAVLSLLGPKTKSKALLIANGYKNIISTMQRDGPKRLITAVSSSYKDPNDKFQFMVEFGVLMLKVLAPSILKDILTTGELIRGSHLDWTIARLPMLKSKPAKGDINIGYAGDGKFNFFELTRADLADFLINQLSDNTYLHKAPAISN
jgi:putative NADH-flavin reductase